MNRIWCIFVVLSISSFALAGEFGKHGLRRIRRDELPRAMPPPEHNTTMFKLHNYTLRATTTIDHHDAIIVEKIKARFAWDQIHSDMDSHSIIRYKLLECLKGDCGSVETNKPFFIEIRQGRQTIKSVWRNQTDPMPEWNILHSIIMALTSTIEDNSEKWARTQNPLGQCETRLSRKNDTQFLREIRNCDFGMFKNQSILNGLYSMKYESDVELNMNAKYHGHLHLVRGSENFQINSLFHSKFGYQIKTEFRIDLEKYEDPYALRFCNGTWSSERCAIEAFGLERVGIEWKELMNEIKSRQKDHKDKFLFSIDPKNDAAVFLGLTRLLANISPNDFIQLLDSVAEEPLKIQHIQAFAIGGEVDLKYMQKHLLPQHFKVYLQALAHRPGENRLVLKEIGKLLDEDHYELSVFVFAAILNRECHETTTKLENCNNGDNKNILKLLGQLETCNLKTKCKGHSTYAALEQLPIERICKYFAQLVCVSPTDVHGTVLNVLSRCDSKYFQDIRFLMNVFHNSCFEPVQDSWSLQALDILLNAYNNQPLAGTLLLRSESEAINKRDKWSYFHQAERALLQRDPKAVESWNRLRTFKVFERNYNSHAIGGNSTIDLYILPIHSLVGNIGRLLITLHNVGINQTRTRFIDITLQKDGSQLSLFTLHQDSENNRLTLLGVAYPELEWKSQQINLKLSDIDGRVPLIAGPILNIHSTGTLSVKFIPVEKSNDFRLSAQLHLTSETSTNTHYLQSAIDVQMLLALQSNRLSIGELDVRQFSNADSNIHRRHIKYPGVCPKKAN